MTKTEFKHVMHNGRQIKRLDPEHHGRRGWRVVSTGNTYYTLREAKEALHEPA